MEANVEVAEDDARVPGSRWMLGLAAVAGGAVGVLGRNAPVAIALRSGVGSREARSCGMEEAAECAMEHLPSALGALLIFGFAIVVVSVLLATTGIALVVVGLVRRRRGRPWVPPLAVAAGTALVTPALWLLVSFGSAVAT